MAHRIGEDQLLDYLEGTLEGQALAEVERAIAAHPGLAEKLEALAGDRMGLMALGAADRKHLTSPRGLVAEAIADAERDALLPMTAPSRRGGTPALRLAVAAGLLLAAGVGTWLALQPSAPAIGNGPRNTVVQADDEAMRQIEARRQLLEDAAKAGARGAGELPDDLASPSPTDPTPAPPGPPRSTGVELAEGPPAPIVAEAPEETLADGELGTDLDARSLLIPSNALAALDARGERTTLSLDRVAQLAATGRLGVVVRIGALDPHAVAGSLARPLAERAVGLARLNPAETPNTFATPNREPTPELPEDPRRADRTPSTHTPPTPPAEYALRLTVPTEAGSSSEHPVLAMIRELERTTGSTVLVRELPLEEFTAVTPAMDRDAIFWWTGEPANWTPKVSATIPLRLVPND